MKMLIVAVHDSKAELFSQPVFVQSRGQAIRSFADAVNDGKSDYARHPGDYSLFELGVYEDHSGMLMPLAVPVLLASGITLVVAPIQLPLEVVR